jgi:hypothetical protein
MAALTRDQLIRRAFQTAGLLESSQTADTEDINMAVDFLGLELDALQAEKIVLRTVERATKALVAGTAEYTLDSDAIDVFVGPDNVAGTIVPSSGAEAHIRYISRHEYQEIPDKTTQSTPSQVFIERLATLKAVLWPVPDATATFRYQKVRLFSDVAGNAAVDLNRKWGLYLLHAVAHRIAAAKSLPLARVRYLREEAERLKAICKGDDVERGHAQFYVEAYW